MKKAQKLLRTIFITGMAFIVNYGISLFLTPFITRHVGTEAYGFVSLAKQFVSYASIATMALTSFAARHITVAHHEKKVGEANVLFSSAFFGCLALATGILAVIFLVVAFLERLIVIPPALVGDVKWLFLLVFVNFWVVTVFSVFECGAFIKDKLDVTGLFRALSYLAEAVTLLAVYLFLPARVLYVGFGFLAASLVVGLSNRWLCRRFLPELRIRRGNFSLRAVKRLVIDGIWRSINSLGEVLNSGLDLIVCDLLLTPLAMGQLAIAKTIYSIQLGLYHIVSQAFQPMFLRSYAMHEHDTLLREMKTSMKVSSLLTNLIFAGFTALGLAYYRLWIPHEDTALVYQLTVLTLMVSVFGGPMHPLYYIYTLTVKTRLPSIITIAGGFANVVGMYVLIRWTDLGVYAVALTTVAVMFVINYGTNPLYMAHVLGLPWYTFYPTLLRSTLACGALVALFWALHQLYDPRSWLTLAACVLVYALLGAVVHLAIVFRPRELADTARELLHSRKKA